MIILRRKKKEVYKGSVSEIEGPRRRGRPVVRWKDRVKESDIIDRRGMVSYFNQNHCSTCNKKKS